MKTILFFVITLNVYASAQGVFVGKDHSATMIQASYARVEDEVGVGAVIGHSFDGGADVGIAAGVISDVLFWGPAFSVYFLNPDSSGGVLASVDLGFTSFSSRYSSTSAISITAGGSAGARIPLFQNFTVAPILSGGFISLSNNKSTYVGGGLSLILSVGRATNIVLTPSVTTSNHISTFGLESGLVFTH